MSLNNLAHDHSLRKLRTRNHPEFVRLGPNEAEIRSRHIGHRVVSFQFDVEGFHPGRVEDVQLHSGQRLSRARSTS